MSATRQFNQLTPQFRDRLPAMLFKELRDHVDNLRFSEAALVLKASLQPGGIATTQAGGGDAAPDNAAALHR